MLHKLCSCRNIIQLIQLCCNMHRRKIQLIACTNYLVSLPKELVKKNNLKQKNEILLHEKNDKTLVISPQSVERKKVDEISLDIDEYLTNIDQVLFAVHYMGIEDITLFSKKEINKNIRIKIRKSLSHMSGTEISYEDNKKISIKNQNNMKLKIYIYTVVLQILDSQITIFSCVHLDVNVANRNFVAKINALAIN